MLGNGRKLIQNYLKNNMKMKKCLFCLESFEKPYAEAQAKWENRKFCSNKCRGKYNKINGLQKGKNNPRYGVQVSGETKKKMSISHLGESSPVWKGDDVEYSALHAWVRRWKGIPEYCENCGKIGKKDGRNWNIHWANIDHSYKRVLDDYIGMCAKCHSKYDIKNNNK